MFFKIHIKYKHKSKKIKPDTSICIFHLKLSRTTFRETLLFGNFSGSPHSSGESLTSDTMDYSQQHLWQQNNAWHRGGIIKCLFGKLKESRMPTAVFNMKCRCAQSQTQYSSKMMDLRISPQTVPGRNKPHNVALSFVALSLMLGF